MSRPFAVVYADALARARDRLHKGAPLGAATGRTTTGSSSQERVEKAIDGAAVVYRRRLRPPEDDVPVSGTRSKAPAAEEAPKNPTADTGEE